MSKILTVKSLSKTYKTIEAVKSISFDIDKGEVFAIIGPNGAGKTSTIRMIATLIKPSAGDAIVDGVSIVKSPDKVREKITYLPDEAGAYKTMTGLKYLKFIACLFSNNKEKQNEYVQRALSICKLDQRINDKISSYSRGMIRKLLLSKTIMTKPSLAILDEPTSGLDIINAIEIRKIIRELASQGMSFLISSHNMLEIEFLSDKVGIINKGILYTVNSPSNLKKEYNASNLEEVFEKVVNSK